MWICSWMRCCPQVVVLGEVRPQDPVSLAQADGLSASSATAAMDRHGWRDVQDRAVAGPSFWTYLLSESEAP